MVRTLGGAIGRLGEKLGGLAILESEVNYKHIVKYHNMFVSPRTN